MGDVEGFAVFFDDAEVFEGDHAVGGDGSADAQVGIAGGEEPVFFNGGSAHGSGPGADEPGEGGLGSEREGEAEEE